MPKPWNKNSAIRSSLRRTFSRSPIVRAVMMAHRREVPRFNKDGSRHKKDAVQYQCGVCGEWVGSTHVAVDHKDSVIPETGFTNWEDFIKRLFCDPSNLQIICSVDHDKKTNAERAARNRLKDTLALNELDKMIVAEVNKDVSEQLSALVNIKVMIKDVNKYLSKSKPQDIRDRAIKLKSLLKSVETTTKKLSTSNK